MNQTKIFAGMIALIGCIVLPVTSVSAQMEFQYQRGSLLNPFTSSADEYHATNILTFQNAGSWKLGSSFFFIDFMDDAKNDGFNDKDFYGEWYPTLSFSKLSGRSFNLGLVRDISFVSGLNFGGDANVFKYLPGIQFSWQVPGFIFVNTDITAVLDYSDGRRHDPGFMFDISWLKIMSFGSQVFSFMGHAEYISAVDFKDGSGMNVAWILAQPQLVWDVGNLFDTPNEFHAGIELQIWTNKLGVKNRSEFRPQLLVVWRLQ